MDFELTRSENDEQLLPQIESIRSGENFHALVPFAKAYLGLFYVIENALPAIEKIKLLANKELADALIDGFKASIFRTDIPTADQIGEAMAKHNEFAEGYVILAGLDLISTDSLHDVDTINIDILESAIAFLFSNKTNHQDRWFDYLLSEHKEKVLPALEKYWSAMLINKACYIPGRNLVLSDTPDIAVVQHTVLVLLEHWQNCKAKILFQLLQLAFQYADSEDFLTVTERVLSQDEKLNEKTRLYWIATAFLLAPEKYSARLSDYVGRVKLKIMPLLDFVTVIVTNKDQLNIEVSDRLVTQLLRMIAPIFPPQHHVYGALGALDINSRNVMLLFYSLVCSDNKSVTKEIKALRKARVMKIYSGVIDNLLEIHMRKNNEKGFVLPGFETYIKYLVDHNNLDGRSNKFDLR
ncbi:MAG: hypothetical protein OEY78_01850 [Gammaproteobacteria bacterium]|nr:hypothetical protein [Gammaproteobacteria bacterium]